MAEYDFTGDLVRRYVHGSGVDDPARLRRLLTLTITVLAELAVMGDFGGDYDRYY